MGNSTSGARRKLGDAIQTRVFQRSLPEPLTREEMEIINKLSEREQQRMQDMPSLEALNAKHQGLGFNLNKLAASISGRAVDVTAGQDSWAASTSGAGPPAAAAAAAEGRGLAPGPDPASLAAGKLRQREQRALQRAQEAADDAQRLPSFLLRELLEQKNQREAAGQPFDLQEAASSCGGDPVLLGQLLEHCCIPQVGKVGAFGHQYAFARPPLWWRGQQRGGQRSPAPWEKMISKRSSSEPTAAVAAPAAAAAVASGAASASPAPSSGQGQSSSSAAGGKS